MKVLGIFDKQDYNSSWKVKTRKAVRGVLIRGNEVLLIRNQSEGLYFFPGGGMKENETAVDTLVREVWEEAGADIERDSATPFGYVDELRKDKFFDCIFRQTSLYYFATVVGEIHAQHLEEYERNFGYVPEWVDLDFAIAENESKKPQEENDFFKRETFVLKCLKKVRTQENTP